MTLSNRRPVGTLLLLFCAAVVGCAGHANGRSTAGHPALPAAGASAAIRTVQAPLHVLAGNGGAPFGSARSLVLPRGSSAEVWARIPNARLEMWTPEGDLLVSAPDDGVIYQLTPGAGAGDPPTRRTLLAGLHEPQGMVFDRLHGQQVLYVAESGRVDRYTWRAGSPTARTIIADHLPDNASHPLKNVVVGADHTVYFDLGSASNATPQSRTARPPRASVLAYSPATGRLRVFATGIRNGDGLSIAPDHTLWVAVNERDDLAYPFHRAYGGLRDAFLHVFTSYVSDHPPDELARLTPGRNLGWPFCDPDPDVSPGVAGTRLNYANMRFDADAQANTNGALFNCSRLRRVERGIPSHSAPLGFHFLAGSALPSPWSSGAVVGAHGSWDRVPPRPPGILWLPWNRRSRTLGGALTLVGGFQARNGSRWGRSVDAVPGPDGALYVSDDTAGAIYRIVLGSGR